MMPRGLMTREDGVMVTSWGIKLADLARSGSGRDLLLLGVLLIILKIKYLI